MRTRRSKTQAQSTSRSACNSSTLAFTSEPYAVSLAAVYMSDSTPEKKSTWSSIRDFVSGPGWKWVPSLYFAEGIPYVVVMTMAGVMYKRMDISNADIALYTSWLYLPWVIKPLWSPIVDVVKTKRWWIIVMQILIGGGLAGVALTLPLDNFFRYSLAFMWLLAFSSSTHDIAADGFYMLGLSQGDQSFFVGIRSTFYRLAILTGQGVLVVFAGLLETELANIPLAWTITFFVMTGLFLAFAAYHFFILPHPEGKDPAHATTEGTAVPELLQYLVFIVLFLVLVPALLIMGLLYPITRFDPRKLVYRLPYSDNAFAETLTSFLEKKQIGLILAFLLLFRFAEAQLVKLASLFLLDSTDVGGLALSTSEVGFVYGTVGAFTLVIGGILGGFLAAKDGLKKWLLWMVIGINIPNAVYIFLAFVQPESYLIVNIAVSFEQFGYGFGFTAYMLYMIYVSEGEHKTAHFALCTGLMALGMMIPGMFSGWIQEQIGYQLFFVWVIIATIPSFVVSLMIPLNPEFGKKDTEASTP